MNPSPQAHARPLSSDEAFLSYAGRHCLMPGQRLSATALLGAVGFERALPSPLQGLIELSDQLEHHAVVLSSAERLTQQWNPYSGHWPLYTEGAFGAQLLRDHRWLQKNREQGVRALYTTLHEVTHGLWAMLGQLGLLSLLPPQERARFHQASEGCAVLMSDLEGPERLDSVGFFEPFWATGAQRTHAVDFPAWRALAEARLSGDERARWLFELYLNGAQRLPRAGVNEGRHAEALAFLIEEQSYAEKAMLGASAVWERWYWGRASLEGYLSDFVPAHPLELPHLSEPISSVEGCVRSWRALTLALPEALSGAQVSYLSARLSLQRAALKVCELGGALESYRLRRLTDERALTEAQTRTQRLRDELLSELHGGLFAPLGELSELESRERRAAHQGALERWREALVSELGPLLLFEHPLLDEVPVIESMPELSPRWLDEPREAHELSRLLRELCEESQLTLSQLTLTQRLHPTLKGAQRELYQAHQASARELFREAHRLQGELNLSDELALRAEVEAWLRGLKAQRELSLPYPLSWLSACPTVDPEFGFRYQ